MVTIEDKLNSFSKIVNDKIRQETDKEFEAFDEEKKKLLDEKKRKLKLREKQILEEVVKKVNIKAKELLAKEKMEGQHVMLKLKKELFSEIVAEVCVRLKEYAESEEYKEYLFNSIRDSVGILESGSYIVYMKAEDIIRYSEYLQEVFIEFDDKSFEIKEGSIELMGGVIVEDKKCRFRIDNSLNSKFEQHKAQIGAELMERLA